MPGPPNYRTLGQSKELLILCLLMLTVPWNINAQEPSPSAASTDVYEAVVRYQLGYFGLQSLCVVIEEKDADVAFSSRFKKDQVKARSGCRVKSKGIGWRIVDKKTGKPSALVVDGPIRWLTNDEAEVGCGASYGNLGAAFGSCHAIREGTRWVVTEFRIETQS